MPRFLLIALNGPTAGEGDDAAYNKWYNEVHTVDLKKVDGTQSVRRFKIEAQNRIDKPYVAVTEIEAENAEIVLKQLAERAAEFPEYIDRSTSVFVLAREIEENS